MCKRWQVYGSELSEEYIAFGRGTGRARKELTEVGAVGGSVARLEP
jgi:hypothetical protein